MRTRDIPAEERLLARLEPQPNGCWHWTGIIDKSGYGRIGYKGRRSEPIQRAVYDCFVGPIPDGHDVDHTCHNADTSCMRLGVECLHRRCGNPAHLEAVPADVNSRRAKERVTTCPRNHPYDEVNTCVSNGRRFCRECNRQAKRRQRARAAS
jgi:hypothetical protein